MGKNVLAQRERHWAVTAHLLPNGNRVVVPLKVGQVQPEALAVRQA